MFVPNHMELKDRVVLVTGASLGLGAEISIRAAREGADVIINYHSHRAAAGALDCLVPYCASKGGMLLITKAMATELAPYHIRVNSAAPGTIDIARKRETDPNYPDDWLPFIPMGRVGVPSDVAKPVIFLASDEAAYLTGQTFWVDGGETSYGPMSRAGFART